MERKFWPQEQKPDGCLSACWAAILGIPVEDVPIWSLLDNDEGNKRMREFLGPFGISYVVYKMEDGESVADCAKYLEDLDSYCILVLRAAEREPVKYHSVVIKGRTIIYNPGYDQEPIDVARLKTPIDEIIVPVCKEPWRWTI